MTKAEAKAMLKRIQEPEAWEPQINQAAFEALDMAIEALSKEPSEDIISRQAAISLAGDLQIHGDEYHMYNQAINNYCAEIMGLPSAGPEIIRCGQCKYAEVADKEDAQDGYTCQFHRGSVWFSGSYCSWAERRTDETD